MMSRELLSQTKQEEEERELDAVLTPQQEARLRRAVVRRVRELEDELSHDQFEDGWGEVVARSYST